MICESIVVAPERNRYLQLYLRHVIRARKRRICDDINITRIVHVLHTKSQPRLWVINRQPARFTTITNTLVRKTARFLASTAYSYRVKNAHAVIIHYNIYLLPACSCRDINERRIGPKTIGGRRGGGGSQVVPIIYGCQRGK